MATMRVARLLFGGAVALATACSGAGDGGVAPDDGGADGTAGDAAAGSSGGDPGDPGAPPAGEDAGPADAAGSLDGAFDAASDAASDAGCGAEAGVSCGVGHACLSDDDCEGTCDSGACAAPAITDGKLSPSLGETDVDCGGALAPKCADAKGCELDGDCAHATCSALTKRCVAAPSCRGGANGPSGLETCGTGEPGAPGAAVESCCASLPLPVRTTRRLDRYEITAGRLRAFVEAIAAANGGVPNIRAFAKSYAAAHPGSELAVIASGYPGLLDVLPDQAGPSAPLPLPVHLGAFPLDPMNTLDGCFVGPGTYGHPTYWQPPSDLQGYGVGELDAAGKPTGVRKYPRETLDAKSVNCVMPLMLATFCAWDGGELARTEDYHEIWGRRPVVLGTKTVYVPWATGLSVGQFNWRNGHGAACSEPWPGCLNPQPYFYEFPFAGHDPSDDDTPAIAAPGRFPLDVTAIVSANGEGWYDVGANFMEAAWPQSLAGKAKSPIQNVCDVTVTAGPGETACTRTGHPGLQRYTGDLPFIALVGYSFEGHERRSEAYLASTSGDEALLRAGDQKPVTFQYGKVGGRCARPSP